jgi:UDP-glucose:(glucosyl)LPS alpha-1,2-glucosyltransferase
MPPQGGTDIMEKGLRQRVDLDEHNVNLILSRCSESYIDADKTNILWQHLNYNEPLTQGLRDKFFLRSVDAFVYVSHWQYEKFRYVYSVPTHNAHVIKNAIEPIEFASRSTDDKYRLIYTSAPFRGLKLLLDAFELLKRDDVELDIYSSTLMYGTDYDKEYGPQYSELFSRAESMDNVTCHGYATNSDVIKAVSQAHIFAYPSVFEETSCLSLIEAGAAGCSIVSHNLGAIYETAAEFATLLPIRVDEKQMAHHFADALQYEIDRYDSRKDDLQRQSDYFNYFYSWDRRLSEWHRLLNELN